jgi:hypothetical protein
MEADGLKERSGTKAHSDLPHSFMQNVVNEVSNNAFVYRSDNLGLNLHVSVSISNCARVTPKFQIRTKTRRSANVIVKSEGKKSKRKGETPKSQMRTSLTIKAQMPNAEATGS